MSLFQNLSPFLFSAAEAGDGVIIKVWSNETTINTNTKKDNTFIANANVCLLIFFLLYRQFKAFL